MEKKAFINMNRTENRNRGTNIVVCVPSSVPFDKPLQKKKSERSKQEHQYLAFCTAQNGVDCTVLKRVDYTEHKQRNEKKRKKAFWQMRKKAEERKKQSPCRIVYKQRTTKKRKRVCGFAGFSSSSSEFT